MIIPAGFAQVNLVFTGSSLPNGAEVVYGVESGAATAAEVGSDVAAVLLASDMDQLFTASAAVTSIRVKLGPNDTGAFVEFGVSYPGLNGANTSGAPQISALFSKQTALGGHRGRGRMYWPDIPEAAVDAGGLLTSAYFNANDDRVSAWWTAHTTAGIPMVVLHGPEMVWVLENGQPKQVPVAGSVPPVPTPLTALVLQQRVATQRRRNRS